MPVSVGPTRQFGECTHQDDAELSEGDHGLTEGLATIRVLDSPSQLSSHVMDDVCPADLEHLYPEDKLGCARGVLWALVFEAGVVIAALVYWKLHLFAR
ncbi:MAG TPA: hypothetical protein VFE27_20355 [Acidobacteriaceae bacterium]|jgi:hypothetical protein|nr:hypothetical protein [Acidobacteriaceae bacterium]